MKTKRIKAELINLCLHEDVNEQATEGYFIRRADVAALIEQMSVDIAISLNYTPGSSLFGRVMGAEIKTLTVALRKAGITRPGKRGGCESII